jgi:hypothetical protein
MLFAAVSTLLALLCVWGVKTSYGTDAALVRHGRTRVLATVAIRPESLAIPGDECQNYAAEGDGSQDSRA